MDNERTYTHPLTGDVHGLPAARRPAEGSAGGQPLVVAVLVLALLLGLAVTGGGCVALRYYAEAREAREALRQADGAIEYEPLSQVNDGSYDESASGGNDRALGALRRLRSRLR